MFKALCVFLFATAYIVSTTNSVTAFTNQFTTTISSLTDEQVAYKTEFSNLIKQQPKRSLETLEAVLKSYQPLIGESMLEFTNRLELLTNLWQRHNVYVYYWSNSRQINAMYAEHITLLHTVLYWLDAQLLPSTNNLTHIIIRNDVSATATTSAVVIPMGTNFRTFVHEFMHVLQQTDIAYTQAYDFFRRTHRRVDKGNFATDYHPNAEEHMAEWLTELLYPSTDSRLIERSFTSTSSDKLMARYLQLSVQLLADSPRLFNYIEGVHAIKLTGRATAIKAIRYKTMLLQL